jgi:hypothetical protein
MKIYEILFDRDWGTRGSRRNFRIIYSNNKKPTMREVKNMLGDRLNRPEGYLPWRIKDLKQRVTIKPLLDIPSVTFNGAMKIDEIEFAHN